MFGDKPADKPCAMSARQAGYFRTSSSEDSAGQVAAEYAFLKLDFLKAAVMHDNDI